MRIVNDSYKYDSVINRNSELEKTKRPSRIKNFLQAFRVDISQRVLESKEYNDPNIKYPTFNPEVLQYSQSLNLIFKP